MLGLWLIVIIGLMALTIVHAVFTVAGAVHTETLLSFFSRTRYSLSWGTLIWLGQLTFRWFTLAG
jgi:ABC-type dipeptide/oligopeptide/nickel transport system permease subunit